MTSLVESLDHAAGKAEHDALRWREVAETHRKLNGGDVPHSVRADELADNSQAVASGLYRLRDFVASGGMHILRHLNAVDEASRGYFRSAYAHDNLDGTASAHTHLECSRTRRLLERAIDEWSGRHEEEFKLLQGRGIDDE